jgi:DNA-binding HxlR family transcriptional regulator
MTNDSSNGSDEEDAEIGNLDQSQNPPASEPVPQDTIGIDNDDASEIGAYSEPDPVNKEDFGNDEIKEFFGRKGAVEIFAQLSNGPKRFSEIDSADIASHGIISTRLTEGARLGVWSEYFHYPDDGGKTKLYELSPAAESLADTATEENIRETTEQLREANQRHTDAVATFRDKISTDDSSE